MAYISSSEIAAYLGLGTDTDDDVLLSELINHAQSAIDQYCDTTFQSTADSSRTFDSIRDVSGTVLRLDRDLASITSITNGDGTTVASNQYVTEPRNDAPFYAIRLKRLATVRWEPDTNGDTEDAITVTGRWAYSTTPPNDVKHATLRLVSWLYRQKDTHADVDQPLASLGGVILVPSGLPNDVRLLLNPYVRRL